MTTKLNRETDTEREKERGVADFNDPFGIRCLAITGKQNQRRRRLLCVLCSIFLYGLYTV